MFPVQHYSFCVMLDFQFSLVQHSHQQINDHTCDLPPTMGLRRVMGKQMHLCNILPARSHPTVGMVPSLIRRCSHEMLFIKMVFATRWTMSLVGHRYHKERCWAVTTCRSPPNPQSQQVGPKRSTRNNRTPSPYRSMPPRDHPRHSHVAGYPNTFFENISRARSEYGISNAI